MRALVSVLAAMGLAASPLAAQFFRVQSYVDREGVPAMRAHAVEQGADGRLWFATHGGIVCYDGVRWQTGAGVLARSQGWLTRDPDGGLWTLSSYAPLRTARHDGTAWTVHEPRSSSDRNPPTAFVALDAERCVVGTAGDGAHVFERGRWQELRLDELDDRRDQFVFDLAVVGSDLFVAQGEVLWRCPLHDLAAGVQVRAGLPGPAYALAGEGHALWVAGDGWVGRLVDGVYRPVPVADAWPLRQPSGLLAVEPDGRGGAYLGGESHVVHLRTDGTFESLDHADGLPFLGCSDIHRDREGNVWLASWRGVAKIVASRVVSYTREAGTFADEVSAICRRRDGTMVLGHGGGLTLFRKDGATTIDLQGSPMLVRVMDLEPDPDGSVWIAVSTRGLARLGADDTLQFWPAPPSERLYGVAHDGEQLWVASSSGLWRFVDGRLVRPQPGHALDALSLRRIDCDADGTLWLATGENGIWSRAADGSVRHWTSEHGAYRSTYGVLRTDSGRTLVASRAGVLEVRDDELVKASGFGFDRPTYFLARGSEPGALWIGTDDGLVHHTPSAQQWIREADGLLGRETNRNAFLPGSDQRVWVGTDRGLNLVDVSLELPERPAPTLDLLHLSRGGERLPLAGNSWTVAPVGDAVAWHFRSISLFDERRLRFRYRLEGLHDEWIGPVPLPDHVVRFPSLPAGSYRLHLVAEAADGTRSEVRVSPVVQLLVPLAHRWWVRLLGLLAVAGVGWLMFDRALQRRYNRRLAVGIEQRTRELERARRALADDRERLARTLGSIAVGVACIDADGRIFLWNAAAGRLAGVDEATVRGRTLQEVFGIGAELPQQGTFSFEDVEFDGRRLHLEGSAAPLGDGGSGSVVAFRDVTERIAFERDVAERQRLESLGLLAGGIAHDFNNYLTVVIGTLGMVADEVALDADQAEQVRQASVTVDRAVSLTQQLLTFSSGGAPVLRQVAVSKLFEDAVAIALSGSPVQCRIEIDSDLPLAEVDEGQVAQALNNLLLNARQAMQDEGTVTLRAALTTDVAHELSDRSWIAIEVEDDGPGIAADIVGRVFDPFFSAREGGTGLGLSVVHSVVQRHGGHISLRSEPGAGACFRMLLPVSGDLARAHQPRPERQPGGSASVLVMDDEEVLRKLIARMLERSGHRCTTAAHGEQAVDLFRAARDVGEPFDVVLLDQTIVGGLGGRETARRLLAIDPDVRLVAISGYSEDAALASYADGGFRAALPKPFDRERLAEVLAAVLGDGRQGDEPRADRRRRRD